MRRRARDARRGPYRRRPSGTGSVRWPSGSPFRGIAVAADVPDSFALRREAAFLTVRGSGALAGWSAAEMPGAECAPAGAPAEVVLPERQRRARAGLIVHRDAVGDEEILRDVPVRVRDRRGRWRTLPGRTVDTTPRCGRRSISPVASRGSTPSWRSTP